MFYLGVKCATKGSFAGKISFFPDGFSLPQSFLKENRKETNK